MPSSKRPTALRHKYYSEDNELIYYIIENQIL